MNNKLIFVLINLFFNPQEARAPNCSIFVYLYINTYLSIFFLIRIVRY